MSYKSYEKKKKNYQTNGNNRISSVRRTVIGDISKPFYNKACGHAQKIDFYTNTSKTRPFYVTILESSTFGLDVVENGRIIIIILGAKNRFTS